MSLKEETDRNTVKDKLERSEDRLGIKDYNESHYIATESPGYSVKNCCSGNSTQKQA